MKPRRIRKFLLLIIIASGVCAAAGAALFLYTYPRERLAARLAAEIGSAIQRKVSIQSAEYGFGSVILKNVTIRDGLSDGSPVLASVEEMRLRFSMRSLVTSLELNVWWVHLYKAYFVLAGDGATWNIERLIEDISRGKKSPVTAKVSRIVLAKCRLSLLDPPGAYRPLAGTYLVDSIVEIESDRLVMLRDTNVRLPAGRGSLSGDAAVRVSDGRLSVEVDEARLDQCALDWVYQWRRGGPLPFVAVTGTVEKLAVSRHAVSGSLKATVAMSSGAVLDARGHCRVDIDDRRVTIGRAVGSTGSSRLAIESLAFTFGGALLRFRLTDIDADVGEINRIYALVPEKLFGRVEGHLAREGGRLSGSLSIRKAGYDPSGPLLEGIAASVTIDKNVFAQKDIPVVFRGQPVRVSVASNDGNFNRIFLEIDAPSFTVGGGHPSRSGGAPAYPAGFSLPVDIAGKASIGTLHWDALALASVSVTFSMHGDTLTINHFSCGLLGGDFSGRGSVHFGAGGLRIDLSAAFRNAKMQEMGRLSERFSNRMYGFASGVVGLQVFLPERAGAPPEMRGSIVFSIVKGKFVNTGIQNGLIAILSELKYKLKDLEFEKITGNIELQGERFTINSLSLQAPELVVTFSGHCTTKFAGDVRIALDFSREFVKDVPNPAIWGIGKYRREGRYRIPVEAKGSDITSSKNIRLAD